MSENREKIKKNVKAWFLGFLSLGVISVLSGLTPTTSGKAFYNWTAFFISAGLLVTTTLSFIVLKIYEYHDKPQQGWLAKYIVVSLFMPIFTGVAMLNLFYASVRDWRWVVPLALMYPAAALLPFVNPKLSETLHDEAFAPNSCLGRLVVYSLLAIGPAAGVFGVFLSNLSERVGNGVIGYGIVGLFFHFLWIWAEVTLVYQVWEERPWRRGNTKKSLWEERPWARKKKR